MGKVTNTSKHPLRVFVEGKAVDVAAGSSVDVPNSSAWNDNVFVKAKWLQYDDSPLNEGGDGSGKPMTVSQIKKALADREIDIPEGVTKRDDLLALLGEADKE